MYLQRCRGGADETEFRVWTFRGLAFASELHIVVHPQLSTTRTLDLSVES